MTSKPLNITKCQKDAQLSKTEENLILSYKNSTSQEVEFLKDIWKQIVTSVSIYQIEGKHFLHGQIRKQMINSR